MYEWYEGGGYSSWGGLAVLDKSGNLTLAPALEGVPIGGYRFEADSLAVSTDKYYEHGVAWWQHGVREPSDMADTNYICRLSMDTLEAIGYEKLGEGSSVPAGFTEVELDPDAGRTLVGGLSVRLRLLEVTGQEPLVLTKADFEESSTSAGG